MAIFNPPQLSPASLERISRLADGIEAARSGVFWERRLHWAESQARARGEPQVIRTAKAFANVLDHMTVDIADGELIVGCHPKGEPTTEIEERISLANERWGGHGLGEWAVAQIPEEARRAWHGGVFTTGSKTGHMTPDYAGLLERGLGGILEHIRFRLDSIDPTAPDYGRKRSFLLAAEVACEAASRFALRYAARAEELREACADEARRSELGLIAQTCRQIAAEPPRSSREALQLAWFLHLWICIENGEASGAFAPGRMDQYLWPFFAADIEAGSMTEAEAFELILCHWVKLNGITYQAVQSVILGGLTPEGEDGSNRLTELCLAATHHLRTLEPALVLRVSEKTPRGLLRGAAKLLRTGIGFPQFYNDSVAVACLQRAGCDARDAREYCIGGCVELTVQGLSNPWVGNFLNIAKCLLLALNRGICPQSNEKLGCDTPPVEQMNGFQDVVEAWRQQLEFAVAQMVCCENVFDRAQGERTPYPLLSANILDCIENGADISWGGARYNFTELQGVGLATTVDSLSAIRRFVFQEGRLTLLELVNVLREDFAGAENLRQELQAGTPRYGNADGATDALAQVVVNSFVTEVEKYENPRGGRFRAGLLVWDLADTFGKVTGATPDGRKSGTVLADCIGPAQGFDREGPTSVIRSATSFSHTPIVGGLVLNMKFMPQTLASDESLEKFVDLLVSYFAMGGMQMQVNVVDDALLRRARECPEQYQDLAVRVSGWSALFLRLSENLQDEIIARTAQEL